MKRDLLQRHRVILATAPAVVFVVGLLAGARLLEFAFLLLLGSLHIQPLPRMIAASWAMPAAYLMVWMLMVVPKRSRAIAGAALIAAAVFIASLVGLAMGLTFFLIPVAIPFAAGLTGLLLNWVHRGCDAARHDPRWRYVHWICALAAGLLMSIPPMALAWWPVVRFDTVTRLFGWIVLAAFAAHALFTWLLLRREGRAQLRWLRLAMVLAVGLLLLAYPTSRIGAGNIPFSRFSQDVQPPEPRESGMLSRLPSYEPPASQQH